MNRLWPFAVGAVGAVLGLFVLMLSGALNFAASSGHWDATDWLLDLAARQSVTLRSLNIEVPALDDPAMIQRGAGHYELVCAACHGSPGRGPEEFVQHLTPRPPLLLEQMQHWRPPARTFWTVKHGIKRTAMPAWPTQLRDDEVWDLVAFIETMPKLSAGQYRGLAGDRRGNICANCHGDDGQGTDGIPRLDIQSPEYLAAALQAFRDGTRQSGMMMSAASGLTDAQIDELAQRLGKEAAVTLSAPPAIWTHGAPERDVPACASCHGDAARRDFPRLAGQDRGYLARQLELFVELGAARGGAHADIMEKAAQALTPEDISALADWLGD
jgi:cytochrome c553